MGGRKLVEKVEEYYACPPDNKCLKFEERPQSLTQTDDRTTVGVFQQCVVVSYEHMSLWHSGT